MAVNDYNLYRVQPGSNTLEVVATVQVDDASLAQPAVGEAAVKAWIQSLPNPKADPDDTVERARRAGDFLVVKASQVQPVRVAAERRYTIAAQ